jgi:AraC-like DNA-binding protein
MTELTVAAGLARGLMNFAVSKGASRAELVISAGINVGDLEDQDNRIPFNRYVALMRAAKELCNDPALALHYGERNDLAEISVVGLIANAAETMLDAFKQLNRYRGLVIEVDSGVVDRFQHVRQKDGLWLVDNRRNPNDFYELTESTFARMVGGTRQFGTTPFVKAVHVTHAEPPYRAEYDRIFQAPVTFEAEKNALLIDETWHSNTVALQPRYVFGILCDHADTLLKSLENSKTIRGRVESLLMPILHTGDIGVDAIAGKMNGNRHTLFRKLKAEGTSFEKVLDDLRHKLALHYLSGKKVSVNETAYLVGFSEPAAFSRAFKRWTGTSPRAARSPKASNNRTGG